MRRVIPCALVLVTAVTLVGGSGAGAQSAYAPGSVASRAERSRERVRAAQAEVSTLREQRDTKREQYKAGLTNRSEVVELERRLEQAESVLITAMRDMEEAQRFAALRKPVAVRLRDATVRQAAQVLTQASGLTIRADDSVPQDTRLTIEARRVPLADLLETVGRQANLVIAPEADGVRLTAPSELTVNGEQQQFWEGPNFPWSREWGSPPVSAESGTRFGSGPVFGGGLGGANAFGGGGGRGGGFGGGGYGGAPGDLPAPASVDPHVPGAPDPFRAHPLGGAGSGPGRLALTTVGSDLIVVAEPGSGPRNEAGVWLTVYRLGRGGVQMTQVSSTFHRTRTLARASGTAPPSVAPARPRQVAPARAVAPGARPVAPPPATTAPDLVPAR